MRGRRGAMGPKPPRGPSLPFEEAGAIPLGRLRLRRALVVLDTETTGIDPAGDRIVELAVVRVEPSGETREWSRRLDPGVPIPPEATEVHGIRDEDVRGCPRFAEVAGEVLALLAGADLAGFNLRGFDLPLLQAELRRAGADLALDGVAVVDAMTVFHRKERRDLSAAVRLYLGRDHAGAHGATADARACLEVLAAQLDRYPDLPAEVEELHRFCAAPPPGSLTERGRLLWRGAEAVLAFGKHKGRTLREVAAEDRGYLEWLVREQKFEPDFLALVQESLRGRFPARKG